jgi:hypothetical protein
MTSRDPRRAPPLTAREWFIALVLPLCLIGALGLVGYVLHTT